MFQSIIPAKHWGMIDTKALARRGRPSWQGTNSEAKNHDLMFAIRS